VFYFDQYVALGAGALKTFDGLTERTSPAGVAEIGFAFWFDRQWELRLGVKDYLFQETRRLGSQIVQHVMVNFALGWMIGGGGA
jgi:hypothetical protein